MDELVVLLGDRVAGTLHRHRGRLRFTYENDYIATDDATPLSVTMPVRVAPYVDETIEGWITGLLPDADTVLEQWARSFGVRKTPFDLLASPVGEDCAGAVRFVAPGRLDAATGREGRVDWLSEGDVAERIRGLRAATPAWLGREFDGRFSLAGMQAKTALLHDEGRWGVPSGAAATSHILKPAINGLDDHELNEYICLRAAALVGLTTARTTLETFEDQRVVVSERYDRTRPTGRGWLDRVHQEDLCQATGNPPTRKYQSDGGPSSADVANLLRRVLDVEAERAVWEFLDALVFNWVTGGIDAHAKNYSILLDGATIRWAPLYDLASALPYDHLQVRRLKLAMKFGGEYGLTARSPSVWGKLAAEVGLPSEQVEERASDLVRAIPDAIAEVIGDPEVRSFESTLPNRLLDAVAARSAAQLRNSFGRPSGAGGALTGVEPERGSTAGRPSRTVLVGALQAGDVISMPESGLLPAIVQGVSSEVAGIRFLEVSNLDTGELNPSTLALSSARKVVLHEVTVRHHFYENISGRVQSATFRGTVVEVPPGREVRYTGTERPAQFPPTIWRHRQEPLDIRSEARPL